MTPMEYCWLCIILIVGFGMMNWQLGEIRRGRNEPPIEITFKPDDEGDEDDNTRKG